MMLCVLSAERTTQCPDVETRVTSGVSMSFFLVRNLVSINRFVQSEMNSDITCPLIFRVMEVLQIGRNVEVRLMKFIEQVKGQRKRRRNKKKSTL